MTDVPLFKLEGKAWRVPRMLASTGVPWKGSAGEPGKADSCFDENDSSHRQRFLTCSLPHSKVFCFSEH